MTPVAYIEVDLFSGRPNPTVEVRGTDAVRLIALLGRDRPRSAVADEMPGLGFRGFLVHWAGLDGAPHRVLADRLTRGGESFSDPGLEVQSFIETLLPPAIVALVGPLPGG